MNTTEQKLQTFVSWARHNLPKLRHEPSDVVAGLLGDAVLCIDDQLGVEVENDDGDVREVIVTSFSDPTLFDLVRRIVTMLSDLPNWKFIALKPPRGFGFSLTVGEQQIDAKSLQFAPILDIKGGLQLILSSSAFDDLPIGKEAEELAWLIVETGVGEELAVQLNHLEFCKSEKIGSQHPITELEGFLKAREWGNI